MKYKSVPCLITHLIILIFINGCKKDDTQYNPVTKGNYSGNYAFTTIFYDNDHDTTMLYDGYINYDDFSKQWSIHYLPRHKIYPTIDSNGVLTYPELVDPPTGYTFSGNIDDYGNINFFIKLTIWHHGVTYITSWTVTGKKKHQGD